MYQFIKSKNGYRILKDGFICEVYQRTFHKSATELCNHITNYPVTPTDRTAKRLKGVQILAEFEDPKTVKEHIPEFYI